MKRLAKAAALVLTTILLLPLLTFLAYDIVVFQPLRDEIHALPTGADPQDRNPPPRIRACIRAMHRQGAPVSTIVGRHLHARFLPRAGNSRWHLRSVIWDRLVALHLSEDEVFGLYAMQAYNGHGRGLNALSQRLYSRPLDALSEREAATLVAYTWAPHLMARRPQALAARRDWLLSACGPATEGRE